MVTPEQVEVIYVVFDDSHLVVMPHHFPYYRVLCVIAVDEELGMAKPSSLSTFGVCWLHRALSGCRLFHTSSLRRDEVRRLLNLGELLLDKLHHLFLLRWFLSSFIWALPYRRLALVELLQRIERLHDMHIYHFRACTTEIMTLVFVLFFLFFLEIVLSFCC